MSRKIARRACMKFEDKATTFGHNLTHITKIPIFPVILTKRKPSPNE